MTETSRIDEKEPTVAELSDQPLQKGVLLSASKALTLPTSFIHFEARLRDGDIDRLKKALSSHFGPAALEMHNHRQREDGSVDTEVFPSIMIHSLRIPGAGKGPYRAALFGVGAGALFLDKAVASGAFEAFQWRFAPEERFLPLRHFSKDFSLGFSDEGPVHRYKLCHWLGLNTENFHAYRNTLRMTDKVAMLERILRSQLKAFSKGVGWHFHEKELELYIEDMYLRESRTFHKLLTDRRTGRKKKFEYESFDLAFRCNLRLPEFLCLGLHRAYGFGRLQYM